MVKNLFIEGSPKSRKTLNKYHHLIRSLGANVNNCSLSSPSKISYVIQNKYPSPFNWPVKLCIIHLHALRASLPQPPLVTQLQHWTPHILGTPRGSSQTFKTFPGNATQNSLLTPHTSHSYWTAGPFSTILAWLCRTIPLLVYCLCPPPACLTGMWASFRQ